MMYTLYIYMHDVYSVSVYTLDLDVTLCPFLLALLLLQLCLGVCVCVSVPIIYARRLNDLWIQVCIYMGGMEEVAISGLSHAISGPSHAIAAVVMVINLSSFK